MRITTKKVKKYDIPDDKDKGYVEIRHLSHYEIDLIREANSTTSISTYGDVEAVVNPSGRANALARKALVGWGNMFDGEGNEVTFNPENVERCATIDMTVDGKVMSFFSFINVLRVKYAVEIQEETEAASGN